MLTWIREKFGRVVISGIIGFIAFVFIFYGIFSPKATRGLHEGAVAGTVNGESITIAEFNREFNRRLEFFRNIGGGSLSEDQLKSFKIREMVYQDLVNRKILTQEAIHRGRSASDHEVRDKIQEIPAFKKDGKFDVETYKEILQANHYTVGGFEHMVREESSLQLWEAYLRDRVHVSEMEVEQEFQLKHEEVRIKYVLLTPELAKRHLLVDRAEIEAFVKDSTKQDLIKLKYDEGKNTLYKNKELESVQDSIARELVADGKIDAIQDFNSKIADQVVQLIESKSSDQKIESVLKAYDVKVKTTEFFSQRGNIQSEIIEAKELMADAFSDQSSIDLSSKGHPKKYLWAGRTLIAAVIDSKKPDPTHFAVERDEMIEEMGMRKSRHLSQNVLQALTKKATIDTNTSVINSD